MDASKRKAIAVLTSGGDAQGMNAAIRAITLTAFSKGVKVYAVYWGYQGLVDGGENIKELQWQDVSEIIHVGGTKIGSARCDDFRKPDGRKKAALNMIKLGIVNLVIIGGDGSLTGADLFRSEWDGFVTELASEGKISKEEKDDHHSINIVGMVGSIDNDFCGTDMTIGADSALHRIVECIDSIVTTAESHQRAFVLEVMGRMSGYLALISSMGGSADYVFLPEMPADKDWQQILCDVLVKNRQFGKKFNIIIVAEGALDVDGNAITSNHVKDAIVKILKYDTRVTVLGHVQRGGSPSAFDRVLAFRFGVEAVRLLMRSTPTDPTHVLCLRNNEIVPCLLSECVKKCNQIKDAFKTKDFKALAELRGTSFKRNLELLNLIKKVAPPSKSDQSSCKRIGIIHVGAPASGMNICVMILTRYLIMKGYEVVGINDGFHGLIKNQHMLLNWSTVDSWHGQGGCNLGTSRSVPSCDMSLVSKRLETLKLSGLVIIGGFEGFVSLMESSDLASSYPAFNIPTILVPATLSNNVPGSDFSLGCDTSLNVIATSCDKLRLSANSSRDRVFIVETMGGKCGYLTAMSAIAGGADIYYTYHDDLTLCRLMEDATFLQEEFERDSIRCGIVIKSESFTKNITTDFVSSIFDEVGSGTYRACTTVLGHVQQGGVPSPFDRVLGAKFGLKAAEWMEKVFFSSGVLSVEKKFVVLGLTSNGFEYTPVVELKDQTDFKNRFPHHRWWEPHLKTNPSIKAIRCVTKKICDA